MFYIFVEGVAGVVALRDNEPKQDYYKERETNGKFIKIEKAE